MVVGKLSRIPSGRQMGELSPAEAEGQEGGLDKRYEKRLTLKYQDMLRTPVSSSPIASNAPVDRSSESAVEQPGHSSATMAVTDLLGRDWSVSGCSIRKVACQTVPVGSVGDDDGLHQTMRSQDGGRKY